jgi:glutaredoxin-like protein NrdH
MKNSEYTLYGKPNCVQCTATERYLKRENIPYTKIDVTEDEAAYLYVTKELGYQQVPVLSNGVDHWSGFNPNKLSQLAN